MDLSCYLVVFGRDLDFDEVTAVMGCPPTSTRRARPQTESMARVGIVPADRWTFEVRQTVEMKIDEIGRTVAKDGPYPDAMVLLDQIRHQFKGRETAIREYCATHDLENMFEVVAEMEDSSIPFLDMPADFVEFVAAMGARLGFDLHPNVGWEGDNSQVVVQLDVPSAPIDHIGKYLPLGSVLTLRHGAKKLMVFGRQQRDTAHDRVFDYVGVPYPEGNITPQATFLFDHDDIDEIHHLGFIDHDENVWVDKLNALPPVPDTV